MSGRNAQSKSNKNKAKVASGNSTETSATTSLKTSSPSCERPTYDGPNTTVLLRNIPQDYLRDSMISLLEENGFVGKFDFVYVPIDFKFLANVGFAFVNFLTHDLAVSFFDQFNGFKWDGEAGDKEGVVTWASPLQGYHGHVEKFRNSPVMHDSVSDEYKPAIFQNGERASFPTPTAAIRAPRMRMSHTTGRRNKFAAGFAAAP